MKAEGVVKVSTKGQIVIPKDVRTQFGIVPGKKLLVAVEGNEILITKMEELSLGELSKKLIKEAPRDDRVLECALAPRARIIVSGDHHLLAVKKYRGIEILKPRESLQTLYGSRCYSFAHPPDYRLPRTLARNGRFPAPVFYAG